MLLHFTERGPASGLPVMLVHPLGADRHFWDPCVAALPADVRALQPDLRGSGDSPIRPGR